MGNVIFEFQFLITIQKFEFAKQIAENILGKYK